MSNDAMVPGIGPDVSSAKSELSTTPAGTPSARIRLPRSRIVFWSCALLASIGFGVYLRAEIHRRVAATNYQSSFMRQKGGTLLIAGGGELPSMVRHRFIELAGGTKARIVVIPAEPAEKEELGRFRDPWDTFAVESVEVLNAESRTQADDPEFSRVLETATAVWLSGGTQIWLAGLYGWTQVETRLKELLDRDGVIGGTSAGAAVMSNVMIAGGRQTPQLSRGFDLIPDAIIDQHFLRRNRFRRLQTALESHPGLIGFGIDEETALQFSVKSGRFRVLGKSCVVTAILDSDHHLPGGLRIEIFNPNDEFDVASLRNGDPPPPTSADLDSILLGE